MTATWEGLAREIEWISNVMRANSERWFPAWHAPDAPIPLDLAYALGLNGEAGEVGEALKKIYRDGDTEDRREALALELADVFTYLLLLAAEADVDIVQAYRMKVAILTARHGRRGEGTPA